MTNMTPYREGYAVGEQTIAEKGLRVAQDIAISMVFEGSRLDMRSIGFRTAVAVAEERRFSD